jgi:hypothetical protein
VLKLKATEAMLVVLLMGLLAVAIGRAGRHTDRDGDHHALHGHGDQNPPGNFVTTVFLLLFSNRTDSGLFYTTFLPDSWF